MPARAPAKKVLPPKKSSRSSRSTTETTRGNAAVAKKAAKKPAGNAAIVAAAYVVKSEPFVYSFDQLVADGVTSWDGVRNFEARNTLRAMKKGDTLFFYHSNEGKEIVGLATVSREAYQDPTTEEDWSSVEVAPLQKLTRPISLATLKEHPRLRTMALVARSRISVTPVTAAEMADLLALSRS